MIMSAVFGEFLAETNAGRAVQPGDEAIDHGFGDQIEAGDAGEMRGRFPRRWEASAASEAGIAC
jgi:hypothetical protein